MSIRSRKVLGEINERLGSVFVVDQINPLIPHTSPFDAIISPNNASTEGEQQIESNAPLPGFDNDTNVLLSELGRSVFSQEEHAIANRGPRFRKSTNNTEPPPIAPFQNTPKKIKQLRKKEMGSLYHSRRCLNLLNEFEDIPELKDIKINIISNPNKKICKRKSYPPVTKESNQHQRTKSKFDESLKALSHEQLIEIVENRHKNGISDTEEQVVNETI